VRYQYRYTKDERRRLAAANRVLDNPTAPPAEVNKALRHIQRIQDAAEARAFDRAVLPAESEPTVDELVSDLENAQKRPFQPVENTEVKNAKNAFVPLEAIVAPSEPAEASEVTQTAQGPETAFCGFCSAVGPWNTRYPVGQVDGILLCSACFSKMCAADMRNASAAAKAAAEAPQDWAEPFAAQRHMYTSDFERSRAIWAEQDREATDRQEQERIERARAEAAYHSARADFISRGGRL
jgi:hypothetical protein